MHGSSAHLLLGNNGNGMDVALNGNGMEAAVKGIQNLEPWGR